MKIAFVVASLGTQDAGGLERVGAYLASALAGRGHDVVILTHGEQQPAFALHPDVRLVRVARPKTLRDVDGLREHLIALQADVCVPMFSWRDLRYWVLAMHGMDTRLCISEHSDPWLIERERWNRKERLACMHMADTIHLLQDAFKDSLPEALHSRVRIIPNPASEAGFARMPGATGTAPARGEACAGTVLVAGRLVDACKQISLAIEAFSLLPPACAGWTLDICGDGPDKGLYEAMIHRLHLHGRVFLHGHCENMAKAYAAADLCAIPSRFEGLSLTMIEAMQSALPIVAFQDCLSMRHALGEHGAGLLAPYMSARSFADTLARLMLDAGLRQTMGRRAQEYAEAFAPSNVIAQWEAALEQCARTVRSPEDRQRAQAAARLLHATVEASHSQTLAELRHRVRGG